MAREFYRRRLPHWHPSGSALLLTTRLAGSLPGPIVAQLKADYELACERAPSAVALMEVKRAYFGRFDALLDKGLPDGPTWLANPAVARLVLEALQWRAAKGAFSLLSACVLANHLHAVVVLPADANPALETTLRDFKQYTAGQANRLLGRSGPFWQAETHDHVIRDPWEGGLSRAIRYVRLNPVKAGLCAEWQDWPFTYCAPEWQADQ